MSHHRGHRHRIAPEAMRQRILALASLPPGRAWHVEDHHLSDVPSACIQEATHAATGEPFALLTLPTGRIIGLSATTPAAYALINWDAPTTWACQQDWWITPPESRMA